MVKNILDLLNSDLGDQIIKGISSKTNVTAGETQSVLKTALPAMLDGLANNANSGGADGIFKALEKHNGSALNDVSGFLETGDNVANDGDKILGHIFGDKKPVIQQGISNHSGVSTDKVSGIISMAAPLLMNFLGKEKSVNQVSDSSGLISMLGQLMGGNMGGGVLTSLLDQNGDGQLGLDDLTQVMSGGNKKGKKGGGLFGKVFGMFGKK